MNTVVTGEAKVHYLHDKGTLDIQDGLRRASRHIDTSLNLIAGRLGLDHDQVLFGRFGGAGDGPFHGPKTRRAQCR